MGLVQPRRGLRAVGSGGGSERAAAGPGGAGAPGEREGPVLPAQWRPLALHLGLASPAARRCGGIGARRGGGGELAPVERPWGLVAPPSAPLLRAGRGTSAHKSPSFPLFV